MSTNVTLICLMYFVSATELAAQTRQPYGPQVTKQQMPVRTPTHPGFVGDTLEVAPLTTLKAMERADRVLYLRSIKSEVKRGVGGNIFTYTTFQVLRAIKGHAGDEITLRLLGGQIDNEVIVGPLKLNFTPGDRFILFFGKDNAEGYPTIIPQAVFEVKMQDGVEVVDPTPTGLQFYRAKSGRAYSGPPGFASLEDFIFSMERAR